MEQNNTIGFECASWNPPLPKTPFWKLWNIARDLNTSVGIRLREVYYAQEMKAGGFAMIPLGGVELYEHPGNGVFICRPASSVPEPASFQYPVDDFRGASIEKCGELVFFRLDFGKSGCARFKEYVREDITENAFSHHASPSETNPFR